MIGIVGAGAIGKALARQAVRAGLEVIICNRRGPEALADLVADAAPLVRAGDLAAAVDPEIVVLAVPWPQVANVLARVPHWEGRILVDATNPATATASVAEMTGTTSSEVVERLAPGAHVVKAFGTLPAGLLAAPPETPIGRRVLFLAGNHRRAKATIGRLIVRMGFAAIDLGTLALGGTLIQAPGGPLLGQDLVRVG